MTEIVRCKDCKHRPEQKLYFKGTGFTKLEIVYPDEICITQYMSWEEGDERGLYPDGDFFCAFGEVKDDELS